MEIKWMSILMLQMILTVMGGGASENGSTLEPNFSDKFAVKSIQSEDGDVIDCIDIYKQPAFNHPALRNHKIQMTPAYDPIMAINHENAKIMEEHKKGRKELDITATVQQLWQKSGSCPEGTVPIRRMLRKSNSKATSVDNYARTQPSISHTRFKDNKVANLLQINHSFAILHTEGYAYFGAKGDIKVWNPSVEKDDEYSISQVALKSGPHDQYEAIESGWAVNPSVYGDRQTRFFVYWTTDASIKTGCFDVTCPGFVQISKDIVVGAAIHPISDPSGFTSEITIEIFKDLNTSNWWVKYGGKENIGYWPGNLFKKLSYHAETVQWGGEVYSTSVGIHPHTATGMGSGDYADSMSRDSAWVKRMRVLQNSGVIKFPDWVNAYADEYDCYDTYYLNEYIEDPEFFYGGPGRNERCP